jgi:hypothetical protein
MGFLSNDYKIFTKESTTLWKEYSDILEIAKKLKNNMKWSKNDEMSFDELMTRVAKAFKNQSVKRSTKLSTPNTHCATDVLKAHVAHKRV